MARDLPTAMDTALAGDGVRLIRLVTLALRQATLRYALAANPVTFGGATYSANSGTIGEAQESTQREVPRTRLTLQNVDGVLGALVDVTTGGLDQRGQRVTLTIVEESTVGDSTAKTEDIFIIDTVRANRSTVEFGIGVPPAVKMEVPFRLVQSYRCAADYKTDPCTSVSTEKDCDKTLKACKARFPAGSALPFLAFPSRSTLRRPVVL